MKENILNTLLKELNEEYRNASNLFVIKYIKNK